MNHILFNYKFFILLFLLTLCPSNGANNLKEESFYYEEKYFRILSNNYDNIEPGNEWKKFDEGGYGFKAKKDFGSLILLKDWSMYNFKLTKVLFTKPSFFKKYDIGKNIDAEMWLIHTKDNGYFPPGRRIHINQNYFIIVVPFVATSSDNPAVDSLLDFLNFKEYTEHKNDEISPKKPIKLYQIIQNQPSYLFEGKYKNIETLFMAFTQYHYINNDYANLLTDNIKDPNNFEETSKVYRNMKYVKDLTPKATLMAYSKADYLKNILFFLIIFLF